MKLKNRVALITGSGQGLGRAIAMAFASEGATIAVNDITLNEEKAFETAEEIKNKDTESEIFLADVSQEDEVNEMVEKVLARFGRIDILVNNAGINRDGVLHKGDTKIWDSVLAVNLSGPFKCTKAALPAMRKQRYGRIVNISSLLTNL